MATLANVNINASRQLPLLDQNRIATIDSRSPSTFTVTFLSHVPLDISSTEQLSSLRGERLDAALSRNDKFAIAVKVGDNLGCVPGFFDIADAPFFLASVFIQGD